MKLSNLQSSLQTPIDLIKKIKSHQFHQNDAKEVIEACIKNDDFFEQIFTGILIDSILKNESKLMAAKGEQQSEFFFKKLISWIMEELSFEKFTECSNGSSLFSKGPL